MEQIIDKKEILREIRKIRREKNITQQELARKVGITKAAISAYELNKTEPKLSTFLKLCQELNYFPIK